MTGVPPRVLGYAVTSCVRTTDPPMHGYHTYYDLTEWWSTIEASPTRELLSSRTLTLSRAPELYSATSMPTFSRPWVVEAL